MANIEKRVKMMMVSRLARLQAERKAFDELAGICDNLKIDNGKCKVNSTGLCSMSTCPHAIKG